jgi:membrane fusion protein, multidrug efflux system
MTFTGRIEAVDKVELRARVDGYLKRRAFTEGQIVQNGDVLFQIEQQQYQAKLDAAQANLARAEAAQINTAVQLRRGQELLKNNNIPAATVDERAAADAEAKAVILQMKAAVEEAQINLSYTDVYAPVTGQIGHAVYSVGNYVSPSSGALATLVSRDPIHATFPVSQRELLTLRKKAEETGLDRSAIKVRLELADGSPYVETGVIDFLNVQVSAETDTVIARAIIPNPKLLLIDGQLVTVKIELAAPQTALFIPQKAVQFDQAGYFVLLVDAENRVVVRRIGIGEGRDAEIQIVSGLQPGERVIVEGIQKVRPNQVVQIADAATAAPAQ